MRWGGGAGWGRLGSGGGVGGTTPSVWTVGNTGATKKAFTVMVSETTVIISTGSVLMAADSSAPSLTSITLTANTATTINFLQNAGAGTIVFPDISKITQLTIINNTLLTISITGMVGLTYLYLYGTGNTVSGSITGMQLTFLNLTTAPLITGVLTGNLMTNLSLNSLANDITWGGVTWGAALTAVILAGSTSFSAAIYREIFINTAAVAWAGSKTFTITNGTSPGYDDGATPKQCKTAYDILKAKLSMTLSVPAGWKAGAYPNDFPS